MYSRWNLGVLSVLNCVGNVAGCCEFSEHSIRRRVCQVQGEFFDAETHTKLIKCINNNCLYS